MIKIGYKLSSEEHSPRDLVRNARLTEEAGFIEFFADRILPSSPRARPSTSVLDRRWSYLREPKFCLSGELMKSSLEGELGFLGELIFPRPLHGYKEVAMFKRVILVLVLVLPFNLGLLSTQASAACVDNIPPSEVPTKDVVEWLLSCDEVPDAAGTAYDEARVLIDEIRDNPRLVRQIILCWLGQGTNCE